MPRFTSEVKKNMQSSAKTDFSTNFKTDDLFSKGSLPLDLLGLNYDVGGNSGFASIAHRAQQAKQLENMINDSVSDEIVWNVRDKKGKVTAPFKFNGNVYYPDEKGDVRIIDQGKLSLATKVKLHRREKVDHYMNLALLGDDICQYMFGVSSTDWTDWTKKDGFHPKANMDESLKKLQCNISFIESLPPSLTQSQSIAKLRAIVEVLVDNVNLEGLSDLSDMVANMKTGKNTFIKKDISKENPVLEGEAV